MEDARLGGDVRAVRGRGGVRAVEFADGTRVACDLLVTAVGWTAPTALLNMAGNRPVYSERAARFFPDPAALPEDVLATGGIAGDGSLEELVDHATATGAEAARRAARVRQARALAAPTGQQLHDRGGSGTNGVTDQPRSWNSIPELPVDAHPELFVGATHGIVDFSEDVSSKDLEAAVAEGFDSAELAKRFTTATMGPLQGKLETVNTVAVVARATGRSIAETGTTTWRPPYAPVTLGALAGQAFEPVRYSPMQPWHEAHGARAADGRRLDQAGPLRRRRGRGAERPRGRRHHRRDPDRQARPARARHTRSCSTCCTSTSGPSWRSAGSVTA